MGLIPNQIFPENAYGKARGRPKKIFSRGRDFLWPRSSLEFPSSSNRVKNSCGEISVDERQRLSHSDDWLVWVHQVNAILPKIGQSPIANSIAQGLQSDLLREEEYKAAPS